MILRLATTEDVPALRRLIPESARVLSVGYYSAEQTEAAIRHVFGVDSQLIADGTYFVIEDDAAIVACGGWSHRPTLYGGDQRKLDDGASEPAAGGPHVRETSRNDALDPAVDAARIRAFFVAPSHARRGIGRRLLEACADAARSAGFTRLVLMSTRPGVPFYTRLGFRPVETVSDTLPDGTRLEFVRMTCAIAPQ